MKGFHVVRCVCAGFFGSQESRQASGRLVQREEWILSIDRLAGAASVPIAQIENSGCSATTTGSAATTSPLLSMVSTDASGSFV